MAGARGELPEEVTGAHPPAPPGDLCRAVASGLGEPRMIVLSRFINTLSLSANLFNLGNRSSKLNANV